MINIIKMKHNSQEFNLGNPSITDRNQSEVDVDRVDGESNPTRSKASTLDILNKQMEEIKWQKKLKLME